MQYIVRFYVLPGKANDMKAWLEENEAAYAQNAPEGWTYLGTWGSVRFFGVYDFESRWELEDYATLGEGWGNETFQRLQQEWLEFIDQARPMRADLMKSVSVINIFPGM
jgi:hypothetical protein